MKRNLITYFLMMVLFAGVLHSGPRKDMPVDPRTSSVIKAQSPLEANDIRSFVWNTGVFNQDLRTNNTPGFEWPKNAGKFAIFTAGLSIGALYEGNLRVATASYAGEYAPGTIEGGNLINDSRFKIYNVRAGDNQFNNPDHANWGLMVPYGAPYVDINENGTFDLGVDVPGIKDAGQTIFVCLTDADPSNHTPSEGYGGGTAPLTAEVRLTAWAYNAPGLEKIQFIQWVTINKSNAVWNATHFSICVDPDLGDAEDDYIGCDTTLNMGFCYNSDNQDGNGSLRTYGLNPPASGMDFFISPIVPTGNPLDTVEIYNPPGSPNKIVKRGYRELGLTSFVYFTNSSSPGPLCERDPSNAVESYRYMQGLKKDGTSWLDPTFNPPVPTKFCYTGDPENPQGEWTEYTGRIENCGLTTTGSVVASPPGDRRFIFNSGATDFTMNPGDTQFIVLAQFVARGSNNVNSVTQLKELDDIAQKVYNKNFKVIPPPPPPQVNISTSPNSTNGTVDVYLSWGDISEYYVFVDSLFNSGTYRFQGYEVYEVRKDLTNIPDLLDPRSDKSGLSLLAVFDKEDSVGIIQDSLKMGITVNNEEQYGYFAVVPAYPFPLPPNFPNGGLSRRFKITNTKFQSVNSNSTRFIYGNSYKFAVVAYGYNPTGIRGGKIIRNSLTSQIITYTPEAPILGTQYTFRNGDTLFTNRRDLGVVPIVVNQEAVKEAKYRIQFGGSDTNYSIYRSFDNGNTFDLMKGNLKFTNNDATNNTTPDDSSRVIDGIVWKVAKIRYSLGSPVGQYPGNVGVVKDPGTLPRDSSQTRLYGWDYSPAQNNPYDSNYYKPSNRPYQSVSMSISYPTRLNYVGIRSLLNPEDLRKVKIVYTGYGNGQQAYRYLAVSATNYQYQDTREVPFKVFEVDPFDGSSSERQINCGFLEFPGASQDNKWEPTTDTSKEVLYIFGSDYNPNPGAPYTTNNLLIQQGTYDVMYIWAPRLKSAGASYSVNDQFTIYPYTVTRPEVTAGNPLFYDIDTRAPIIGSNQIAVDQGGLQDVKVVPNPYYGFNNLETSTSGRFVTFRNLPKQITVKIYSLNGDLIKTLSKNDNTSTMRWDLNNQSSIPIASGIYIALLDAPGIGTRTLKIAVFTPEERIDF